MEYIDHFLSLYNEYCIQGIFISVLVVLLTQKIFKDRIDIKLTIAITKWGIISYSIMSIGALIISLVLSAEAQLQYLGRMTGPYWWAYWWMLVLSSIVPLLLLFKKIGRKKRYLLIISLLMNFGWLYESFIIHGTSIHRDFIGNGGRAFLPFDRELDVIYRGISIGMFVLLIGNIPRILKTKKKHTV